MASSNVEPVGVKTELAEKKELRVPMDRKGFGRNGKEIQLLTNHFKVKVANLEGHFYNYSVTLSYDDGHPAEAKGIGRKILDKLHETYSADLAGKVFAYDGQNTLFTYGALPDNKMEFTVVLEQVSAARTRGNASSSANDSPSNADRKRMRMPNRSKTFKVELSYAAKIPLQSLADAMCGRESNDSQEAIRVLDIILRQRAATKGCLLVRQSFFDGHLSNRVEIGGNIWGCRGFHSSFRTTQGGMSLNMDVATTTIIKPGPVIDFLIANQKVRDPFSVDWSKAKRTLKNLRIKVSPSNQEYRITGMSEKPCNEQTFQMKKRIPNENERFETIEVTVAEYFREVKQIDLGCSANLPCINVGKANRPTYIPIEFCSLIPLQRYKKALTTFQRSDLVRHSRQEPQDKMNFLSKAVEANRYGDESLLSSCGISISSNLTQVQGRILPTPKLRMGRGFETIPRNGRWNFNNQQFVEPVTIKEWIVVNFSVRWNVDQMVHDLIRIGRSKGIEIDRPLNVFNEINENLHAPPPIRVETFLKSVRSKSSDNPPQLILGLLPDKNSDLYGPFKKINLTSLGVVSQCLAPKPKQQPNEQYLTNLLLKINAKLGGLNTRLSMERTPAFAAILNVPTIIFGMDVSHGSPGQSDVPSIAAVVSSRGWPPATKYRASVRAQNPRSEMIESLFQKNGNEDHGIIRELLSDFCRTTNGRRPEHIIIFRDGVSESQFNQVLNIELDQIIEACKFFGFQRKPKFLLLVAQKGHHTKFFQDGSGGNVPPGTIIDRNICHPKNNDFYLCAHAGVIGTTRPTHYHVLYDEIGYSPDELQDLVHSLSYVYQRSTTAISVVAPIRYAHLAAVQFQTFMKFENQSEASSSHAGITAPGPIPVPQLPKLREEIDHHMFFC